MIPRNLLFQSSKSNDPEIFCSVCKNIPLDAMQCASITCTKFLYCLCCLDQGKCPNCKTQSCLRKLAGPLRPKIKGLRFYCPNQKFGCQEIVEYEYFTTHTKNCKYGKSSNLYEDLERAETKKMSSAVTNCQLCGGKIEEGESNSHDCRMSLRKDIEEIRRTVNYMKSEDSRRRYDDCLMEMGTLKERIKNIESHLNISPPPIKKPASITVLASSPDLESSITKSMSDKVSQSKNSSHKEGKDTRSKGMKKVDSIIRKCKKVKSRIVYANNGGGLVCGDISHSAFLKINEKKGFNFSSADKILCSYNLDSNSSAFGDSLGQLSFYEIEDNKVTTMKLHSRAITSLMQRPGTEELITGSIDSTIGLVNYSKKKLEKSFKIGKAAITFEFLNNQKIIYSTEDKYLSALDLDTGAIKSLSGPFNEYIIDMISLGSKVMMSCSDKNIYIYDIEKTKVINQWNADVQLFLPSEHLLQLDSNMFVCPNSSNHISLWDIDGNRIAQLKGHSGSIRKIMNFKNSKFVSCADDGKMIIWSAQGKLFSFNDTNGITTFC